MSVSLRGQTPNFLPNEKLDFIFVIFLKNLITLPRMQKVTQEKTKKLGNGSFEWDTVFLRVTIYTYEILAVLKYVK